MAPSSKVMDI